MPSPLTKQPTPLAQTAGPLFVVSMWRSGSSLLYALLNKHPQVGLMYEADLLLLRAVFRKPRSFCDWAERWQFWNQAFTRHGLTTADGGSGIVDFREAFETVHKEFARRKGASIWGDKSPNYYDRLQEMAETFPDAKFILVWRDPAGTANSILRAAKSGNSYFSRKGSTLRGLLGYEVFKQQYDWLISHGKSVFDVSYEDLVSDTTGVMQQVCDFLQIPYHGDLASLRGSDRSAIYGGEHHSCVKGDQIVSAPRPNVVNDSLREKILKYVAYWRTRYGTWPPFALTEGAHPPLPTLLQRVGDKIRYRLFRAYDAFTAFCFCMAPLSLLQMYRNRKYKKSRASADLETQPQSGSPKEA